MGNRSSTTSKTPSHGNPASSSKLNTELNNVARNTDDTNKARSLVASGADLSSTNGPSWRHTPLHQAAYHGRYEMAKTLIELGAPLNLHSNPCGRGSTGIPLELARGGGHTRIADMIQQAMNGSKSTLKSSPDPYKVCDAGTIKLVNRNSMQVSYAMCSHKLIQVVRVHVTLILKRSKYHRFRLRPFVYCPKLSRV